jgi:hypothetical protein
MTCEKDILILFYSKMKLSGMTIYTDFIYFKIMMLNLRELPVEQSRPNFS